MNLKDNKFKKVFKSKKNIFTIFSFIFILIFLFNLIAIEQEKNYVNIIQQKINATHQKAFVNIGTMNVSRKEHIAIKLQDGNVFIAGGTYNNYSEIYNPNTYQFQKKQG